MARLRQIKKWGNTHTIVLHKSDLIDLKLREGDFVDIDDLIKINYKEK